MLYIVQLHKEKETQPCYLIFLVGLADQLVKLQDYSHHSDLKSEMSCQEYDDSHLPSP